jgi:hypothetical protein
MEEDYFAPLGMSSYDFNSMIRRRSLADMTQQLIEQGRVTLPGASAVPSKTAKPMDTEHDTANMPEPQVADGQVVARASSSVYSRDIDGNSYCFTTPVNTPCSSWYTTLESQSPALMPSPSSGNSSRVSVSGSFPTTLSRASSISTNVSFGSGAAAPNFGFDPFVFSLPARNPARMSNTGRLSLPTAASNIGKQGASDHSQQRQKLHDKACGPVFQASRQLALDLPTAITALLQRYEQRNEPQELQPPVDRIVELGRLRRAIWTLDFDPGDMTILASDLTSLVPMPSMLNSLDRPEMNDDEESLGIQTKSFFRECLARMVQRRLTFLRLELKNGNARKVENWYRDVVDLVGWRDEAEPRLLWSWQEDGGFF